MNFLKSYQLGMSSHNHSRVLVRHFFKLFLPLSALVGGVLGVIYYGQVQAERIVLKTDELRNIEVQAKVINQDFKSIVSDLMVVSGHQELEEILNNVKKQPQALAQEFLIFSQQKKLYDQVRLLDQTGKEVIRVNFNQGQSRIVPEAELHNQSHRYWFKDTLRLNQGEIFVSPLDLNIERGKVEQPPKPMIRFGTPIFDSRGQKRGIVVLNYLGKTLLDNFNQANHNRSSELMLLNAEGYWLKGTKPEDEWGFMFTNRHSRTFGRAFPQAWRLISQQESGQFKTSEGLFTFTTIYPLLEGQKSSAGAGKAFAPSKSQIDAKSYYWKIVSRVTPKTLNAQLSQLLKQLLLFYAGLTGLIGIGSWLLATGRVNREIAEMELKQSEARLQELAQREDILKARLSSQIRNSLDLNTILSTAVGEIRMLLGIDRCQFLWCEIKDESIQFEISHEACNPDLPNPFSYSPIQKVEALGEEILRGNTIRLDDIARDSWLDAGSRDLLLHLGFKSLLAVAIRTHSGRLGAIACEHSREIRPWSEDEVELLQTVADQLAIAIYQSELYHQSCAATAAATAQAEQLNQALHQLKQTQAQLIQTEKMSSLGQLVAGIAHEINNPVNFIYGNLTHVNQYTQDLLDLIELYQNSNPNPSPEVQDLIEAIDLNYLVEDLPKTLASMKVGADRIRQIVLSLRNFSRLDEADMKPVNIHEGIDSTLLILQNRLKETTNCAGIEIVKEYGEIPLVECYAGQLNQVFMNLINNAIDALKEGPNSGSIDCGKDSLPKIWIKTEVRNPERITIRIADNGPGMTEAVQKRLFDPFFTTKPVGKGTGLGLAISAQIVTEKHGGSIWCVSQSGKGTEFWVEIPIRQNINSAKQVKTVSSSLE
jgi:signal transduction histidine kinase